jgi:hypothetical protein
MKKKRKKMASHWYHIIYEECVLCGLSGQFRERVYGKKPKDYQPDYKQYVCCDHFL